MYLNNFKVVSLFIVLLMTVLLFWQNSYYLNKLKLWNYSKKILFFFMSMSFVVYYYLPTNFYFPILMNLTQMNVENFLFWGDFFNFIFFNMSLSFSYFIQFYFFFFSHPNFVVWVKNVYFFLNYFSYSIFQCQSYVFMNYFMPVSYSPTLQLLYNFPWFMYFFFLYLFLCCNLVIFLNYLTVMGIFYMNFLLLGFMWMGFLYFFKKILVLNFFYYMNFGKWFLMNFNYKMNFDFFLDSTSFCFAFLTTTIAIFVNAYSFAYFRFEPLIDSFIIFLNWFIVSMLFLLFSGNLMNLFLGWELMGMTSFLLMNFWTNKSSTFKAGFKAYSFNKVSDWFLLISMIGFFNLSYSCDLSLMYWKSFFFDTLFLNSSLFFFSAYDALNILLFGSICIKSAQFGGHVWLPDSMEAPVPASALIHSATLVSAGIFLLLKFTYFFEKNPLLFFFITITGLFTASYGGLVSSFQSDTKKILAYSTMSHCGFLVMNYTFLVFEYTILYLYIHGFIKALVFMAMGNINRFSFNNQDFSRMGGYMKFLPFETYLCLIGLAHLSGLPLTFGFYMKHFLFLSFFTLPHLFFILLFICLIGGLTGLIYSSRLYWNMFFDWQKAKKSNYNFPFFFIWQTNYSHMTSFLSNCGIMGLFFIIYMIVSSMFIYFLKFHNFSVFYYYHENFSFFLFYLHNLHFLMNLGLMNWIIMIFIVSLSCFFTKSRLMKAKYFETLIYSVFFLM